MPYIKPANRAKLDPHIADLMANVALKQYPECDGELNYIISRIVANTLGPDNGIWSYYDIARAIAVFECAKLEFYRRIAAPKEDRAMKSHGDIYEYETAEN